MSSPTKPPLTFQNPNRPVPLWPLLLACIGMLFTSCTQERETSRPIRFAFQNRVGSVLSILAVEKGFFSARGLDVCPLRFNNDPACAETIYAGSADIGTMGKKKGGRESMAFKGMGNQYPLMILARTAFLTNRSDEAKAFMLTLKDAETHFKAHPRETTKIMDKATGLSQTVLTSAMERHRYALGLSATTRKSLSITARFLKNQGIITAKPNLQETCTDAYLP